MDIEDCFYLSTWLHRCVRHSIPEPCSKITSMDLSCNKLTSAEEISGFKNLTWLSLARNMLREVPVELKLLLRLCHLDLSHNSLTSCLVPKNLKTLQISNNKLTCLELCLPNLSKLCANNNMLQKTSLSLPRLQHLECYNNLLTELPVLHQNLRYMDISRNQLTNLNLIHLASNLNSLIAADNMICSLSAIPKSLKNINLSGNSLCFITTELTSLNVMISGNPFQHDLQPCNPKVYSLKEFCFRSLGLKNIPKFLSKDLNFSFCSKCQKAVYQEYIDCVTIQPALGHPRVPIKARYCSLQCFY